MSPFYSLFSLNSKLATYLKVLKSLYDFFKKYLKQKDIYLVLKDLQNCLSVPGHRDYEIKFTEEKRNNHLKK